MRLVQLLCVSVLMSTDDRFARRFGRDPRGHFAGSQHRMSPQPLFGRFKSNTCRSLWPVIKVFRSPPTPKRAPVSPNRVAILESFENVKTSHNPSAFRHLEPQFSDRCRIRAAKVFASGLDNSHLVRSSREEHPFCLSCQFLVAPPQMTGISTTCKTHWRACSSRTLDVPGFRQVPSMTTLR